MTFQCKAFNFKFFTKLFVSDFHRQICSQQSDARILVTFNISHWKSLTKSFMKWSPGLLGIKPVHKSCCNVYIRPSWDKPTFFREKLYKRGPLELYINCHCYGSCHYGKQHNITWNPSITVAEVLYERKKWIFWASILVFINYWRKAQTLTQNRNQFFQMKHQLLLFP